MKYLVFLLALFAAPAFAASWPVCDESGKITMTVKHSSQPLMYGDVRTYYDDGNECRLADNSKFRTPSGGVHSCWFARELSGSDSRHYKYSFSYANLETPGTQCTDEVKEYPAGEKNPKDTPDKDNIKDVPLTCTLKVRFYDTYRKTSYIRKFDSISAFHAAASSHFLNSYEISDEEVYRAFIFPPDGVNAPLYAAKSVRRCGDSPKGNTSQAIWKGVWNNPRSVLGHLGFDLSYIDKEEPKDPPPPNPPDASASDPDASSDTPDSPKNPKNPPPSKPDNGNAGNPQSGNANPPPSGGNGGGSNGGHTGGGSSQDGNGNGGKDGWEGNVSPMGDPVVSRKTVGGRWGADFFLRRSSSAVCPADKTFTVFGMSFVLSYENLCKFLKSIAPVIQAICMFMAGMMVINTLRAK